MIRLVLDDDGSDDMYWMISVDALPYKAGVKVGHIQQIGAIFHFKNRNGELYDKFTCAFDVKRTPEGFCLKCQKCGQLELQGLFLCKQSNKKYLCNKCFAQVWLPYQGGAA